MAFSHFKGIISGSFHDTTRYLDQSYSFGPGSRPPRLFKPRVPRERRYFSVHRARRLITYLVQCNFSKKLHGTKMLTFTFSDNEHNPAGFASLDKLRDLKFCNHHWTAFIKRLNAYLALENFLEDKSGSKNPVGLLTSSGEVK